MNIMNTEYISKCGDYKLEIVEDEYTESPNEWGNEDMFLVYDHRQFFVRRDGFEPQAIYQHLQAKKAVEYYDHILKDSGVLSSQQQEDLDIFKIEYDEEFENYYIYPVAAYIHSGVSLSLTDGFKGQGFDTSVTGFVLVEKDKYITSQEIAKEYAQGLIETWNTYLMGDVYGFRLYKADKRYSISADNFQNLIDSGHGFDDYTRNEYFTEETEWNEIDSCWGFYGSDIKINGILDHIDDNIEFEL